MSFDIILAYLVSFVIIFIIAYIPSNRMKNSNVVNSEWYNCIRPSITPPNYVFPIVWSILYFILAIVLANILLMFNNPYKHLLLFAIAINLLLNILWTYAYFINKDVLLAFIIIFCLLISIFYIIITLFSIGTNVTHIPPKWIGVMLIPYLLWITFATILNGISLYNMKKCEQK